MANFPQLVTYWMLSYLGSPKNCSNILYLLCIERFYQSLFYLYGTLFDAVLLNVEVPNGKLSPVKYDFALGT